MKGWEASLGRQWLLARKPEEQEESQAETQRSGETVTGWRVENKTSDTLDVEGDGL